MNENRNCLIEFQTSLGVYFAKSRTLPEAMRLLRLSVSLKDDRVFDEMAAVAVDHPLEAKLGVFDDADRVIAAYLSNDVKVGHRPGAVDVSVEMEPLADARTEARIKDIVEPARHREVVLRHVERGFIRARDLHSRAPRVVHQREKVVVDMIVRVKPQRKRIIYPSRQNAFISEFQRIRNDVPALVGIVQHKDCRARLSCDLGGAVGAIVRDDIDVEKFFGIVLTGYQIRDRRADHVLFVVSADQNADPVLVFRNGKLLLGHPKQEHIYQLKQKRYAYYEQHHVVDVSQHVVKLLVPLHGFSPPLRRIGSRPRRKPATGNISRLCEYYNLSPSKCQRFGNYEHEVRHNCSSPRRKPRGSFNLQNIGYMPARRPISCTSWQGCRARGSLSPSFSIRPILTVWTIDGKVPPLF